MEGLGRQLPGCDHGVNSYKSAWVRHEVCLFVEVYFFFWFEIHTGSAPIISGTHTDEVQ